MDPIDRLRGISLVEGTTLLILLFVAVPLEHVGHLPLAVRVVGPLHGLAFCVYLWAVVDAVSGPGWTRRDAVRLVLVALVPFGGFANAGFLRRRAAENGAGRA